MFQNFDAIFVAKAGLKLQTFSASSGICARHLDRCVAIVDPATVCLSPIAITIIAPFLPKNGIIWAASAVVSCEFCPDDLVKEMLQTFDTEENNLK